MTKHAPGLSARRHKEEKVPFQRTQAGKKMRERMGEEVMEREKVLGEYQSRKGFEVGFRRQKRALGGMRFIGRTL